MNFQKIPPVGKFDSHIDIAFKRAKKRAEVLTETLKVRDRVSKQKRVEVSRVDVIKDILTTRLDKIVKSFPSYNSLPEFYRKLMKYSFDVDAYRKSLSAISWASKTVRGVSSDFAKKLSRAHDKRILSQVRRSYYGRVNSVLKQVKNDFVKLDEYRRALRKFPDVKDDMHTIAIFGFPNVGKTTLMSKLSGSTPEIAAYAFTTKSINVAYVSKGAREIQLLDTPGTLNRFEKMNDIERMAYLALKHFANRIVYVFDLTEPYPLEDQISLYKRLKEFKKPITVYLSKSDLLDKKDIKEFRKDFPEAIITLSGVKKEF